MQQEEEVTENAPRVLENEYGAPSSQKEGTSQEIPSCTPRKRGDEESQAYEDQNKEVRTHFNTHCNVSIHLI